MFVATYIASILVNYFYGPFATKEDAERYFEFFDYEPSKHREGVWTNSGNYMLGCPPSSMTLMELTPPPNPMPSCGPWSKAFVVADVSESMRGHNGHIGPFATEDDAESYLRSQGYSPERYRPYIWATYAPAFGIYLPDREAIIVKVRGWSIA